MDEVNLQLIGFFLHSQMGLQSVFLSQPRLVKGQVMISLRTSQRLTVSHIKKSKEKIWSFSWIF